MRGARISRRVETIPAPGSNDLFTSTLESQEGLKLVLDHALAFYDDAKRSRISRRVETDVCQRLVAIIVYF